MTTGKIRRARSGPPVAESSSAASYSAWSTAIVVSATARSGAVQLLQRTAGEDRARADGEERVLLVAARRWRRRRRSGPRGRLVPAGEQRDDGQALHRQRRGCRGSSWPAGWPCRPARAGRPRSSRSARARPGTARPSRPPARPRRRCRPAENSSAGNTFSMSRWAIMLPIVARRSPAITTPPGNVAATIVVPCGARSPRPVDPAGSPPSASRAGRPARPRRRSRRRTRCPRAGTPPAGHRAGRRGEPSLTGHPSARTTGRTPRR